jgi:hypothetical protein
MKVTQRGTKRRSLNLVQSVDAGCSTHVRDYHFGTDYSLFANGTLYYRDSFEQSVLEPTVLEGVTGVNITGTQGTHLTRDGLHA